MLSKQLTDDFWWVGTLDPDLRIFDIVMNIDHGTTYNSYVLKGKNKTVVFEAAKAPFLEDYLEKVREIVPIEEIDILVVDHSEPDHTGTIEKMLELNPKMQIVGTSGALNFLKEITNREFTGTAVKDGDEIDIGGRTLRFIMAPNLHWPDTMFTWVPEEGLLVTCDVFGAHYSYEGIVNDASIDDGIWMEMAHFYFDAIISPFRADVRTALKKIEGLDIRLIATGHGPALVNNPRRMIDLYAEWSSEPDSYEKKTVIIPYVSAYGYTKLLAQEIRQGICDAGDIDVRLCDMVYSDPAEVLCVIKKADGFLFGTPTILGEALPPIWDLASRLTAREVAGKYAGAFGAYGWSGEGVPHLMERLKQLKVKLVGDGLRVRFKPDEAQREEARAFGELFGRAVLGLDASGPQGAGQRNGQ
ncbi:MAG: FprA family A-type flavoprotein [Clostridiales bacterium]|nr:FprA family A-type flavoprotein [Clostridiales bacterium]